jgi:hypothetical protein
MKVNLGTIELTDLERKAFRKRFGASGMATRAEVAAEAQRAIKASVADGLAAVKPKAAEPKAPARRAHGPKCRHCGNVEGAGVHTGERRGSGGLFEGAHKFEAAAWPEGW